MKNIIVILLIGFSISLSSCKKEVITNENGRLYVAPIVGNNIPIEGSFSITFLKDNKASIFTGSGDGKSTLGAYKIDGNFTTKGSTITVTSKGLETMNLTVVSETEISTGNGSLVLRP